MTAFDNKIIGYKSQVGELLRISDMIRHKDIYEKLGARIPRNAMLIGGPGNGKTTSAMQFIKEMNLPSFVLRRSKSDSKFFDEIATVFSKAKESSPSIILCDDIDHWAISENDTESFTALQSLVDSISHEDVFVIATANNIDKLPGSLTRSGRFDIVIEFDNPKGKDLEDIIIHYLKTKALAEDINFTDIAKMCSIGMNCSSIDNVLNIAAIIAGSERAEKVGMNHIVKAMLKHRFGECSDFDIDETERERIIVHEAAHIAVIEVCQDKAVGFSSVICKADGNSFGFTTKSTELKRRPHAIMAALAGKVGSEMKYFKVASGCISDITKAAEYLSEGIMLNGNLGFGNVDVSGMDVMSEGMLFMRDTVIRAELERYYMLTKELLMKNMDFYNKLIAAMLIKNTLLFSDIREIKSTCKIVPIEV